MKDSLIIVSGGMDSITLLYEKRDDIALAVTYDYGSKHNRQELEYALYHCRILGIEQLVIPLDFFSRYFKSSLLEGGGAIPECAYSDENMKSTVVPFRNGIMLSIACGLAETRGLHKVLIANHSGDHAIYPDCRPEFVKAMDNAMTTGTYEGVKLAAPYTNITKGDIVKKGVALGIDYGKTYSCYRGKERHCGRCGTCQERKEAFKEAGIIDPTNYED